MNNSVFHISSLMLRQMKGELSPQEAQELKSLLDSSETHRRFFEELNNDKYLDTQLSLIATVDKDKAMDKIKASLFNDKPTIEYARAFHRVHFLKTAWFRYAAAVILILGIGTYIFISKQNIKDPIIAQQQNKEPGQDKAILTLSDGREIILDDLNKESISDGNISIDKANGILTYNSALTSAAEASAKAALNIMSTPRGGQYQLVLPDGSRVWLNSASSLKYPTVFKGENRTVELSGEAYFDVKANKKMPFVVKTQKAEVLVLGTAFNINSYSDEPEFSATLINGSIKVSAANNAKVIVPGQQAQVLNSLPGTFTIKNDVDVNQVIAWQKGIFEFNESSLDVIARQLSRWYDVKIIVAKDNRAVKFSGGITRRTPLETLLRILETNGVKNKWNNNIITLYSN